MGDGAVLLLGHATRSPRSDIPKGQTEPGESFRAAAVRELAEETGLIAPPEALTDLGTHAYYAGKDLALFAWAPPVLPLPGALVCVSCFRLPSGEELPEFDRFGLFAWDAALALVGKNLARVLTLVRPAWPAAQQHAWAAEPRSPR